MFNDYLIAGGRIRTAGRDSDLVALGLKAFRPFEVAYDPAAPTAAIIEMNRTPHIDAEHVRELTRFDLEGWGGAECIFGRTDKDYVLHIVGPDGVNCCSYIIGSPIGRSAMSRAMCPICRPCVSAFGL